MRYRETLTVPIVLDRDGRTPLHDQIADQLMSAIRAGNLAHGTRMPSTRTLAGLLGVSRGVAATGYDVLTARGFAEGRGGSGTYVVDRHHCRPGRPRATAVHLGASGPRSAPGSALRSSAASGSRSGTGASAGVAAGGAAAAAARPPVDLRPGQGNAAIFPLAAWRSAWRQASCQVPPLDGPPELGLPRLRAAIAEHLVRTRGLTLDDHEVVVTGGTVPGLRLVLDALAAGPVAVEEPALRGWRAAVTGAGRRALAVGVDAGGVRVDDLPADCRAAVITTDGHTGWGCTMSAGRRAEVGAWSASTGATVVEMACDAVFRPASTRLPRLLDGAGTTVLVGGFCDALTPSLRLGYLVVPKGMADRIGRAVADRGEQPPYVTQMAVTQLLTDGTITRLMHRRGLVQHHQLGIVEEALARLRPLGVTVRGQEAAGSVALRLPTGSDAVEVAAILCRHGVPVPAMDHTTLLLGHGHLSDSELRRGLTALVGVLGATLGTTLRATLRTGREIGSDDLAA